MATIGSIVITADLILSAIPRLRPALLAAAPAAVRREVKARFRRAWEEYVESLHRQAKKGNNGLYPTHTGGVVTAEWWKQRRPPILDPAWAFENPWVWGRKGKPPHRQ